MESPQDIIERDLKFHLVTDNFVEKVIFKASLDPLMQKVLFQVYPKKCNPVFCRSCGPQGSLRTYRA